MKLTSSKKCHRAIPWVTMSPDWGSLVDQVLKDNRVFSQHVTRIEFEGWNRALGC